MTSHADEPALVAAGVGLMLNRWGCARVAAASRYPFWACDNGVFSDRWDEGPWLDFLATVPTERCLFAVAPDVYPDAAATLERSARYFDLIRSMGHPVALVAQDGAERLALPWDDFDALFIGGQAAKPSSSEWKVSDTAARLVAEARNRGKWVHMGRVNSLARLRRARDMGCLSADGTYLKYRRRQAGHGDREDRGALELGGWHRWLDAHPPLSMPTEAPAHPTHRQAVLATRPNGG